MAMVMSLVRLAKEKLVISDANSTENPDDASSATDYLGGYHPQEKSNVANYHTQSPYLGRNR